MQPDINLYKIRLDSESIHSYVKYIEISNVFQTIPIPPPN